MTSSIGVQHQTFLKKDVRELDKVNLHDEMENKELRDEIERSIRPVKPDFGIRLISIRRIFVL